MIDQLKSYVEQNNLHIITIENFWVAFNNWKTNNPEEYAKKFFEISPSELNVFVHSIGLRSSEWPECDFNHVTITVLIHYGERRLGNYVAWFSLRDDVDDDDFLEIS